MSKDALLFENASMLQGPNALRDLLKDSDDLDATVSTFQTENAIAISSLHPALKILDLHDINRHSFNVFLVDKLCEKIKSLLNENKLDSGSQDKITNFLLKAFQLRSVPTIRPLVIEALRLAEHIDDRYLETISNEKDLYIECDITVRQRIWICNEDLYNKHMRKLIDQYIQEQSTELRTSTAFYSGSSKARRQRQTISEIVETIGSHTILYTRFLHFIKKRFFETKCQHYGTLRIEILLAAIVDTKSISEKDDIASQWARILDPCLRDRYWDDLHVNELKQNWNLWMAKPEMERKRWLFEISLINSSPFVTNFLYGVLENKLRDVVINEWNFRQLNKLDSMHLLLTLLYTAEIVETVENQAKVKFDGKIWTEFFSELILHIIEESARIEETKKHAIEKEMQKVKKIAQEALNDLADVDSFVYCEPLSKPTDTLLGYLQQSSFCARLYLRYTITTFKQQIHSLDHDLCERMIITMQYCVRQIPEPDWNYFVTELIELASRYQNQTLESPLQNRNLFDSLIKLVQLDDTGKIRWHFLMLASQISWHVNNTQILELISSLCLSEKEEKLVNLYHIQSSDTSKREYKASEHEEKIFFDPHNMRLLDYSERLALINTEIEGLAKEDE